MQLIKAINHLPLDGCKKSIGSSTCMQDIESAFCQAAAELDFPYVNYSFVQNNDEENPTSNLNVSFTPIFSNFPEAWMKYYVEHKFYEYDAILHTLEHMPINASIHYGTWDYARKLAIDHPKGKDQRQRNYYSQKVDQVFVDAQKYGLNSGVYIIHRTGPVQIIISMASLLSPSRLDESIAKHSLWKTLTAITVLANHTIVGTRGCDQCTKNVRIYGIHEITFTATQKAILRCYAEKGNATLKDVATAQGTSAETVKFHLKSIRTKLNKPKISGYALARFAIDHNLI